ncbi:hypothetical protein P691DRAFT_762628 [Macrolepiota fuliginosa MF-IS2]|uniref:Uncharacterized protein n=1 Tax=Macrolepiota fuliginosa MF-IS2 TaxID=1400762 RepID=A0A9P5X9L7_9AGAR|nr:hypothetical protein P691DRAFT_762628 [Macrolepiota fuliginosa MF-IS2]
MPVRGEDNVWGSEMWWDFNTRVQLGLDDIPILVSDGLSDDPWDEDVLDEVLRFKKSFLASEEEASHTAPATATVPTADTKDQKEKLISENDDSGYSSAESSNSPSSSNTNLREE